jgi:hypothetical protein
MNLKKSIDRLRGLIPHNKPSEGELVAMGTREKLKKEVFQDYLSHFAVNEKALKQDMVLRIEEAMSIQLTDRTWMGIENALNGFFIETYLDEIAPDHIRELPYKEQVMNCLMHQNNHVREKTLRLMAEKLGLDIETFNKIRMMMSDRYQLTQKDV